MAFDSTLKHPTIKFIASGLKLCSYQTNIDELVERKYHAITKGNEYEKRMKTLRYLYGKGYESDLVSLSLDKLIGRKA